MTNRLALFALAITFALSLTSMGCAGGLRSLSQKSNTQAGAKAKSDKEIAACEKMCSMAGDAEDNQAAVADCKKSCSK